MLAFKEPRLARVRFPRSNADPISVLALGVFALTNTKGEPVVRILCETEDGMIGGVLSEYVTFEKPLMDGLEKDE